MSRPVRAAKLQSLSQSLVAGRRARLAWVFGSVALLAACGGSGGGGGEAEASATASEAAADAVTESAAQRTLLAVASGAKITTTTGPLVADRLGACTEVVSSSWDLRLAACNASASQSFQFLPVASSTVANLVLIKNTATGLCVTGRGSKSGAFVDLDDCNGRKAQ